MNVTKASARFVRRLRSEIDRGWVALRAIVAAALALALVASELPLARQSGRAHAQSGWVEFARADFTGVADGPGDGKSHPAAVGTVTTSTSLGKVLKDVAAASGIAGGKLVLSDNGTAGAVDIGYRVGLTSSAAGGVYASFLLEARAETGSFTFALTDSSATDFCCPGSVGDGATVELCSIKVEDSVVLVQGVPIATMLRKGGAWRFEIALTDVANGADTFEVCVSDLATGAVERVTGELGSAGYKAVRALTLRKRAGKVGDLAFDDFLILAPPK